MRYLTTESDESYGVPNAQAMADQVAAMYGGRRPVTTLAVARALGLSVGAVDTVLRRAANNGLVGRVHGRGWVPLAY